MTDFTNPSSVLARRPDESAEDFLWRLGSLKEAGVITFTWPQLAIVLNEQIQNLARPLNESTWRKKYQQLVDRNSNGNMDYSQPVNEVAQFADAYSAASVTNKNTEYAYPAETEETKKKKEEFESDKMVIRLRDERYAINRMTRSEARKDAILDLFRSEISRYPANRVPHDNVVIDDEGETAVYALLSDVHYGIAFNSVAGRYDSDVARRRVMKYADEIIRIGKKNGSHICYVSLLGDMISGIIHAPIRIENRENAVEQVVGVSELVADFLYALSQNFSSVYVNSVSGNHSRLDMVADNSLRAEKLDALVPWYCKAKLENVDNVEFIDNVIDPTICSFMIFDKNYVGVHGDYDKNIAESANRIERLIGMSVDYMVFGHMHTPNMMLQERGYIRNGSVCGSGDDYTVRNRLFSNPFQVCMIVNANGIQSLWPVELV